MATSPAVVEALRWFGAKRISVATSYPKWNNMRLRVYLEAQGFEVRSQAPCSIQHIQPPQPTGN